MRCEEVRDRLADYLAGELPDSTAGELQRHVDSCSACRGEIREIEAFWTKLGDVPGEPAPTAAMRARFDEMLDAYRLGHETAEPRSAAARRDRLAEADRVARLRRLWHWSPVLQAAAAAALLLVGVGIGRLSHTTPAPPGGDLGDVRRELHDVREMLTLSLMQQQSATERLRGVSWSNQIDQPGHEVVGALLDALAHDSNVNVRLAAVDALKRFSGDQLVRERTVQALTDTSFPLLQVALIDFVVETRETEAVATLRRLSEDPGVNASVRTRAEWGLRRLSS
jgi:Putative zinc-finger/HEAT repeats